MFKLFLLVSLLVIASGSLRAAPLSAGAVTTVNDALFAAVTAADDERLAATKAADRARLDVIMSDSLRYAHSNGKVDTKASLIETLITRATVYESFDYRERIFTEAAPGVVLMSGRVLVHLRNGDHAQTLDINYLAVWRNENGRWRFLAWQSCRNPPPAPVAEKK